MTGRHRPPLDAALAYLGTAGRSCRSSRARKRRSPGTDTAKPAPIRAADSGLVEPQPGPERNGLFTDDGVALGVGVQSSEERHAGRFLLALGETGTGGGDAGRRIHLVRAHCGSGIGVRCDHLDAAALLAQALDLALQVRAW